jgi:hypothetical protein
MVNAGEEARKKGDIRMHLECADSEAKAKELKNKMLHELTKEIRKVKILDRKTEFDTGFNVGIETAAHIVETKELESD